MFSVVSVFTRVTSLCSFVFLWCLKSWVTFPWPYLLLEDCLLNSELWLIFLLDCWPLKLQRRFNVAKLNPSLNEYELKVSFSTLPFLSGIVKEIILTLIYLILFCLRVSTFYVFAYFEVMKAVLSSSHTYYHLPSPVPGTISPHLYLLPSPFTCAYHHRPSPYSKVRTSLKCVVSRKILKKNIDTNQLNLFTGIAILSSLHCQLGPQYTSSHMHISSPYTPRSLCELSPLFLSV